MFVRLTTPEYLSCIIPLQYINPFWCVQPQQADSWESMLITPHTKPLSHVHVLKPLYDVITPHTKPLSQVHVLKQLYVGMIPHTINPRSSIKAVVLRVVAVWRWTLLSPQADSWVASLASVPGESGGGWGHTERCSQDEQSPRARGHLHTRWGKPALHPFALPQVGQNTLPQVGAEYITPLPQGSRARVHLHTSWGKSLLNDAVTSLENITLDSCLFPSESQAVLQLAWVNQFPQVFFPQFHLAAV